METTRVERWRRMVENGKENEKARAGAEFEEYVIDRLRGDGFEYISNLELERTGFHSILQITRETAFDGAVRRIGDEVWSPLQIKLTFKRRLKVSGRFFECLDQALELLGSSVAYIATNDLNYDSLNPKVKSLRIPIEGKREHERRRSTPAQKEIIRRVREEFTFFDRANVILPCGYGKTHIGLEVAFSWSRVVFLVPTRVLLEQTRRQCLAYCPNVFAFQSDGGGVLERRFSRLKERLEGLDRFVVVTTYHSSNVLESLSFDFAVFDEAHRTAGREQSPFGHLVTRGTIGKRLFLTATPREIENSTEEAVLDMSDETQYGRTVVNKGIREGIQEGRLSPYEVICFAQEDTVNNDSRFVFSIERSIRDGLVSKIILFANKHEELDRLEGIYSELFPDRCLLRSRASGTNENRRLANEFGDSKVPTVLLNCDVFSEGYDIAGCDGVTFYGNTGSLIKVVQGIGRALRLDPSRPDKTARVLVPAYLTTEEVTGEPGELKTVTDVLKLIYRSDGGLIDRLKIVYLSESTSGISWSVEGVVKARIEQVDRELAQELFEKLRLQIIIGVQRDDFLATKRRLARLRLRNEEVYMEVREKYGLPLHPEKQFGDFTTWADYLGHRKEEFWTVKEIREALRSMKGKDPKEAWEELRRTEPKAPYYFEDVMGMSLSSLFTGLTRTRFRFM